MVTKLIKMSLDNLANLIVLGRSILIDPFPVIFLIFYLFYLGGLIIIECIEPITSRPMGQVVLDYMTDSVLAHNPHLIGGPSMSPDSLHVVTIDRRNNSVTIIAQETSENGELVQYDATL